MTAALCSWRKFPALGDRASGSSFHIVYVSRGAKGDKKLPNATKRFKKANYFSYVSKGDDHKHHLSL
jgi:hypothetical protein